MDYTKLFKSCPNMSLKILQMLNSQVNNLFQAISDDDLKQNLGLIVRTGNFELVRYIVKERGIMNWNYGMNVMHKHIILQGDEAKKVKGI